MTTDDETPITARDVLEAVTDYVECRNVLNKQLDNYDGYSPDYHFSREFARRAELEKRTERLMAAFVRQVVRGSAD